MGVFLELVGSWWRKVLGLQETLLLSYVVTRCERKKEPRTTEKRRGVFILVLVKLDERKERLWKY